MDANSTPSQTLARLEQIRSRIKQGEFPEEARGDVEFLLSLLLDARYGWGEALETAKEAHLLRKRLKELNALLGEK